MKNQCRFRNTFLKCVLYTHFAGAWQALTGDETKTPKPKIKWQVESTGKSCKILTHDLQAAPMLPVK